jgi:hypothetical protein
MFGKSREVLLKTIYTIFIPFNQRLLQGWVYFRLGEDFGCIQQRNALLNTTKPIYPKSEMHPPRFLLETV